ncbi:serine hydrolase [Pseudomaricurvus alcaniphilus]|uniref:serine hydrolase n=1 Tax=Pseudomaricurvus alcaniphilus TaxID=1166482 RepID=UPI00140D8EC4|nr:serine hydrolase [Pseudomaricurvus alcaniphilus]NHN36776.1 serine hydrolase [Pseudomaricurvus alcaniphilus]
MKNMAFVLLLCSLVLLPLTLHGDTRPQLPLQLEGNDWLPLYKQVDPTLQKALEKRLDANPAWKKLIRQKKMAVALVDLSDPDNPHFARVNGRQTMYSASMPKIAILLAAFQQIEDGKLELTPELKKDLNIMIRKSSNTAATRVIDRVGGLDSVNAVLSDPRYKLYDKSLGGGLWVGKRYAKSGRRVPDPIYGVSHGASVMQVARFYYLLATGRLVSPQRSAEMLDTLVDPGIKHKFVAALQQTAPDARIYRKSGTWKIWHADSALVWGPVWRRYILVGVVESEDGGEILKDLVAAIESVLPHS